MTLNKMCILSYLSYFVNIFLPFLVIPLHSTCYLKLKIEQSATMVMTSRFDVMIVGPFQCQSFQTLQNASAIFFPLFLEIFHKMVTPTDKSTIDQSIFILHSELSSVAFAFLATTEKKYDIKFF